MIEQQRPNLFAILIVIGLVLIVILAGGIAIVRSLDRVEPAVVEPTTGVPTAMVAAATPEMAEPTATELILPTDTPEPPPAGTNTPSPTETLSPTNPPAPSPTPIIHTVQSGEVLSNIAFQYGVTVETILLANDLINPDAIFEGQQLIIPTVDNPAEELVATPSYEFEVIGFSAQGRAIESFSFGEGDTHVLFVGAIHGGYEWNTAILAYQLLDYFLANPDSIPENVTLHIIPSANPDGIVLVTGREGRFTSANVAEDTVPGRFNGNNVDLNRNWDCDWSPEAFWRDNIVSAGTGPFSEPENVALRDYILEIDAQVVVFWHSALGAVSPGRCAGIEHPASLELAAAYSQTSGYPVQYFTAYAITGDASDWLVTQNIPSFAVELTTHEDIEFARNLDGVINVLNYFAE